MRNQVVGSHGFLQPDSATWRALKWMALDDPLRPLENNDSHVLQRFTLATLYFEWSGNRWVLSPQDGWLRGDHRLHSGDSKNKTSDPTTISEHECDWEGIKCDSENHVTSLVLNGEESGISLVGTIPSHIANLKNLQELRLSGHKLKGTLPKELAELQALTLLDLSVNQFATMDYPVIGKLGLLETLDLNDNQLRDSLTEDLSQLVHLRYLDLSANENLMGNPFAMMMHWPNLTRFEVGGTHCTGSLPDEMGQLSHLETIVAGFSYFDGTIPKSIASCTKLQTFNMGGADSLNYGFVGTIPTELGNLVNLEFLSISANRLESTLPTEMGLMTSLKQIGARDLMGLHGNLPTELALLSNSLLYISLYATSLTGTVPMEYARLTNLQRFDIVGTQIGGNISGALCGIESLIEVRATCLPETCACCTCARG